MKTLYNHLLILNTTNKTKATKKNIDTADTFCTACPYESGSNALDCPFDGDGPCPNQEAIMTAVHERQQAIDELTEQSIAGALARAQDRQKVLSANGKPEWA